MKQADREIIDQLNRIYDAQAAGGGASFASLTGSPEDNAALDAALDAKQGDLGFTPVPDTRTVNGHALSGDVTVSKGDVGLGNADNTADTAKPVSTDQATAIAGKVSDTAYDATSWDGVTTIAPSKNAVRDKFEAVVASITAGDAGVLSSANSYTDGLVASVPAAPASKFDHTTDSASTSTDGSEDILRNDNYGGMLTAQGQKILASDSVQFVSSATAARRLRIYFGNTIIWDSGSLTLSLGGIFNLNINIYYVDSSNARCVVVASSTSASTVPYVAITDVSGLDWSGAPRLQTKAIASGTGAASGDIISKASTGSVAPAGAIVD